MNTEEQPILKPCPFCGSSVDYYDDPLLMYHEKGGCCISDNVCDVDLWNQRVEPSVVAKTDSEKPTPFINALLRGDLGYWKG